MMRLAVFALLFAAVYAGGHYAGHYAAPIAQAAPIVHYAERTQALHHPGTVQIHERPATIVAQGPAVSGFSFNSQVRHYGAPAQVLLAAPVVRAAPIHHGARLVQGW